MSVSSQTSEAEEHRHAAWPATEIAAQCSKFQSGVNDLDWYVAEQGAGGIISVRVIFSKMPREKSHTPHLITTFIKTLILLLFFPFAVTRLLLEAHSPTYMPYTIMNVVDHRHSKSHTLVAEALMEFARGCFVDCFVEIIFSGDFLHVIKHGHDRSRCLQRHMQESLPPNQQTSLSLFALRHVPHTYY